MGEPHLWYFLTILVIHGTLASALYLMYGVVQLSRIEQRINETRERLKNRGEK